jgi:hypothetical protein
MWTRIALFVVAFTYLPIVSATATPVTWESVGTIGFASDPMNLLPGVSSGSPYTFRFTFDPAATSDGLLSSLCGGTVSTLLGAGVAVAIIRRRRSRNRL